MQNSSFHDNLLVDISSRGFSSLPKFLLAIIHSPLTQFPFLFWQKKRKTRFPSDEILLLLLFFQSIYWFFTGLYFSPVAWRPLKYKRRPEKYNNFFFKTRIKFWSFSLFFIFVEKYGGGGRWRKAGNDSLQTCALFAKVWNFCKHRRGVD